MSERANITSVEALGELKPAVITFAESCQQALMTGESGVQRALAWITREQLPRFRADVRRGEEEVTRTHSVMKSRMTGFGSQPQAKVDDVLAWQKANRRLEESRHKLEASHRWARTLQKAAEEYRGAVAPLGWFIRSELASAVGALDQMGAALEAYAAVRVAGDTQPNTRDHAPEDPQAGDTE